MLNSQLDEECKRNRVAAVPDDLHAVLTENQVMAIRRIEGFGWELKFVRRVGIKKPIAVVRDPAGKTLGVLEDDGRINLEHQLRLRP